MLKLHLLVAELIHETELLKFPTWPIDFSVLSASLKKSKKDSLKVFIRHMFFSVIGWRTYIMKV